MTNSTTFSGVGIEGMSWTLHVAGTATAAAHSAASAHHAVPRPERRAAAATVASVNRGTT